MWESIDGGGLIGWRIAEGVEPAVNPDSGASSDADGEEVKSVLQRVSDDVICICDAGEW